MELIKQQCGCKPLQHFDLFEDHTEGVSAFRRLAGEQPATILMNRFLHKATKSWLFVLCKRAHPENIDAFDWFINILAHLFNLFQIFSSLNFKHQKVVSLSKIRMFPTSVFCHYVKLNLHRTNQDGVSSYFFKQLSVAASSLRQRS